MGRLVQNHSTHIEGLIKTVKVLLKSKNIKSITPGCLKKVKTNSERLNLRITKEITGGYKLTARKGRMLQEVYILTLLEEKELKRLIDKALV